MYHRTRYPVRRPQRASRPVAKRRGGIGHCLKDIGKVVVTALLTTGINHFLR